MLHMAQGLTKSPLLIKKDLKPDGIGKPWCRVAIWPVWKKWHSVSLHRMPPFPKMFFKSINWDIPTSYNVMCFPALQWLKSEASPGHITRAPLGNFLLACLHNSFPSNHKSPVKPSCSSRFTMRDLSSSWFTALICRHLHMTTWTMVLMHLRPLDVD